MKKFHVTIKDVRERVFEVEAESVDDARDEVLFGPDIEPISDVTHPTEIEDVEEIAAPAA